MTQKRRSLAIGKYNPWIDILKYMAALVIVSRHTGIPGIVGRLVSGMIFSTPVFFMISGYYALGNDVSRLIRKAMRMLYILLGVTVFYVLWLYGVGKWLQWTGHEELLSSVLELLGGEISIGSALRMIFLPLPQRLIDFLAFDVIWHVKYPMWFLAALFRCYLIMWILRRCRIQERQVYWTIPVLLTLALGAYASAIFTGEQVTLHWIRNAVLFGWPFFMMGMWIRERRLEQRFSLRALGVLSIISMVGSMLEGLIVYDPTLNFSGAASAVILFMLAIRLSERNVSVSNTLSMRLADASMVVYIVHVALMVLLRNWMRIWGWSMNLKGTMLLFVMTALLSTGLGLLWSLWNRRGRSLPEATGRVQRT